MKCYWFPTFLLIDRAQPPGYTGLGNAHVVKEQPPGYPGKVMRQQLQEQDRKGIIRAQPSQRVLFQSVLSNKTHTTSHSSIITIIIIIMRVKRQERQEGHLEDPVLGEEQCSGANYSDQAAKDPQCLEKAAS